MTEIVTPSALSAASPGYDYPFMVKIDQTRTRSRVQPQAAIPGSVAFVAISPKRISLDFPFVSHSGWIGDSVPVCT
jgi:hypothetical protein